MGHSRHQPPMGWQTVYEETIMKNKEGSFIFVAFITAYSYFKDKVTDILISLVANDALLAHLEFKSKDIAADQGDWLADCDSSANWDVGEEIDVHGDDSMGIYGLNIIRIADEGINCLKNVKDAEEACSAKLCEKRRLTDLTLCWIWSHIDSRNTDLDENVLDNLQPPKCLRNMRIKRYMCARSVIWMNNVNPIFNLEKIKLTGCLEWETLPPFGQLPFLESLELSNMRKVKWLESKFNGNDKYRAFLLLEVLYIWGLEALEDLFEAGVAAEDGCLFPCLIELVLRSCPKLKELLSLPSKLKRAVGDSRQMNIILIIRTIMDSNISLLAMLGRGGPEMFLKSFQIQMLEIKENDVLISFPIEVEQWFLQVSSSFCEINSIWLNSLQPFPSCEASIPQRICVEEFP
ncbi:hypothetical protein M5K25_009872 [Dendrobium thyrsiflorum]|uniref:R13L1/DRL21-like LRR repeat region domain-containing protein n=1 Tax=Dendrobium thyrsiflorum TaxID=117978 RepID=A0ABD0V6N9_DENTH